jgi:general secretion pathway protein G
MIHDTSAVYQASALKVRKGGLFALDNRGFTLVELIAVSAILAILAALALPAYSKIKDQVRQVRAMEEIRGLEKGLSAHAVEHGGVYPERLEDAGLGTPLDPWGNKYIYHPARAAVQRYYLDSSQPINTDYDLYSTGVDGQTDLDIDADVSRDDIVRTGDGGFVGIVKSIVLGG